jgi:hypothetical protein
MPGYKRVQITRGLPGGGAPKVDGLLLRAMGLHLRTVRGQRRAHGCERGKRIPR